MEIRVTLGIIGISLTVIFGIISICLAIKNHKKNEAIKRIRHHASQSQSICTSIESLQNQMNNKIIDFEAVLRKLEAIWDNMASLNGVIQEINNEYKKR